MLFCAEGLTLKTMVINLWFSQPPHILALKRDNNSDHKPEDFTGTLARRFAKICGGACITWTEQERTRIRDEGTDATNRDPNYLKDSELLDNPWFAALRSLRESKVSLWDSEGAMKPCLHVDVHGMKDPPLTPSRRFHWYRVSFRSHFSLSLNVTNTSSFITNTHSAMRRHFGDERTNDFVRRLEKKLIPLLDNIVIEKERLQCHCGLQTPTLSLAVIGAVVQKGIV